MLDCMIRFYIFDLGFLTVIVIGFRSVLCLHVFGLLLLGFRDFNFGCLIPLLALVESSGKETRAEGN